jgi:hypothetical protein
MSSVEPAQARFFFEGVALPWFRNEYPLTKRVIEAIPLDRAITARPQRRGLRLNWRGISSRPRTVASCRRICGPWA